MGRTKDISYQRLQFFYFHSTSCAGTTLQVLPQNGIRRNIFATANQTAKLISTENFKLPMVQVSAVFTL
jgi:hypothetical protein